MSLFIDLLKIPFHNYCHLRRCLLRLLCLMINFFAIHSPTHAQFQLGENPGYYGSQYTDQQLYDLMYAAGARSTRSSVSVQFDLQYGMPTFQARLQYPYSTKGMRNNTFFLFASAGPTYSTESAKKTAGGNHPPPHRCLFRHVPCRDPV